MVLLIATLVPFLIVVVGLLMYHKCLTRQYGEMNTQFIPIYTATVCAGFMIFMSFTDGMARGFASAIGVALALVVYLWWTGSIEQYLSHRRYTQMMKDNAPGPEDDPSWPSYWP